jgi:hypothetical protein
LLIVLIILEIAIERELNNDECWEFKCHDLKYNTLSTIISIINKDNIVWLSERGEEMLWYGTNQVAHIFIWDQWGCRVFTI